MSRRYVLSAPSGTGKTTALRRLLRRFPDLSRAPSFTTRAPRPGEVDGRDYRFVQPSEFARLKGQGRFAEATRIYGSRYASAPLDAGGRVVVERDARGYRAVKAAYPDAVGIFLIPPSPQALAERLEARNSESPARRARRLAAARAECRNWRLFDYVVIAESERATEDALAAIINGAGERHSARNPTHARRIRAVLEERWRPQPRAAEPAAPAMEM